MHSSALCQYRTASWPLSPKPERQAGAFGQQISPAAAWIGRADKNNDCLYSAFAQSRKTAAPGHRSLTGTVYHGLLARWSRSCAQFGF
jgi:hypothetical protein